jgi:acetyl esterase/lipase
MERVVAGVLRKVLAAALLPTFRAQRPIESQRRRLEKISALTLAPRARYTPAEYGGVRGESVTARTSGEPDRAILYLHGGAFCVGSPRTHRAITGTLARLTGAQVFAADYRLAPEHPFPAALDDALAAYRGLLERGYAAQRVALVGDSAGGGLALSSAIRLRELGAPLPAALVAFSPWVDLGAERDVVPHGEVMISPPWVAECARLYLAGRDVHDPLASPIYADVRGLPPTLLQVGTDEVLLSDSQRMRDALQAAGVTVGYQEYPRRWHVFQANAGMLADADRALAAVAGFLRERWAA